MRNVRLQQLDILDANASGDVKRGAASHDPAEGLAALNSKLKPGGYFKIGLYSKLARQKVSAARKLIKNLGIQSTPEGIRDFRKQVFDDDQHELKDLSELASDFYSLSECRDLCFHVQEHQFTTETLEKLLEAEHLAFCGFMLPKSIKAAYQHCFPEDSNGHSATGVNSRATIHQLFKACINSGPTNLCRKIRLKTKATNDKTTYCYQRTETNDFSGLRRADHSEAFIIMASSSTSLIDLPND